MVFGSPTALVPYQMMSTRPCHRQRPTEHRSLICRHWAELTKWAIVGLSSIPRGRKPDAELVSPRVVHAPNNINVSGRIDVPGRKIFALFVPNVGPTGGPTAGGGLSVNRKLL